MHYLRRICLKDKLLWNEYLERIEIYHQENEEEIIRIYQATMQIIPNFMIEVRYLYFLIRRINKHLIQAQNEDYAASWQDKVIAVRDFISEGLNKKRKDPKE